MGWGGGREMDLPGGQGWEDGPYRRQGVGRGKGFMIYRDRDRKREGDRWHLAWQGGIIVRAATVSGT